MKKTLISLFTVALFFQGLYAQVGLTDPGFNIGSGFGPDQWTGKCEVIVQQSDGKLIVGGQFTEFNGQSAPYIVRLNLDGTPDTGFSSQFQASWGYNVRAIALQDDGKILIGGTFNEINGVTRNRIARLNSNGTLDESFNPASGFNQEVTAIDIQEDGKILVGGLFTTFDYIWGGSQTPARGLARLNSNGSLDTSFDSGNGFAGSTGIGQRRIHKILVQPDGKILVSGHFSIYNDQTAILLLRLNTDGTVDDTFNANDNFSKAVDGFYGQVYDMALLPDGKIMIAGNYLGNANGLDRLKSDGSLDDSFKITPAISDNRSYSVGVQSDGKIVAARVNFGIASEAFVVERYNTDGTLDAGFPRKFLNNDVTDLVVQKDGNITLVGYFNYNPIGIIRLIGSTPTYINLAKEHYSDLIVYPNPAYETLHIVGVDGSTLAIADFTGRVVLREILSDRGITTIDLKGFVNGTYLVRLVKDGAITTKKLIVKK